MKADEVTQIYTEALQDAHIGQEIHLAEGLGHLNAITVVFMASENGYYYLYRTRWDRAETLRHPRDRRELHPRFWKTLAGCKKAAIALLEEGLVLRQHHNHSAERHAQAEHDQEGY